MLASRLARDGTGVLTTKMPPYMSSNWRTSELACLRVCLSVCPALLARMSAPAQRLKFKGEQAKLKDERVILKTSYPILLSSVCKIVLFSMQLFEELLDLLSEFVALQLLQVTGSRDHFSTA